MNSSTGFSDGSKLPSYETGGSLHRDVGERRVHFTDEENFTDYSKLPDVDESSDPITYKGRVHVTQTNDAEALADIWGAIIDGEPLTGALTWRFIEFVESNFSDSAKILLARTHARNAGQEARIREPEEGLVNRYAFGSTGV